MNPERLTKRFLERVEECKKLKDCNTAEQAVATAQIACAPLRDAGKQCYLVGGAVRDLVMGLAPGDVDLTTDATPDEMDAIYGQAGYKTHDVGKSRELGTIVIVVNGENIEVTTFRQESEYSDGRHPDEVAFVKNVRDDLARRDLTINAMAMDPFTLDVVDPFGGMADLDKGIIRAVGNPSQRFDEDPLRTFRACRFGARFGFPVESATFEAIKAAKGKAATTAKERVRMELMKMLKQSERPSKGIECLRKAGLLELVLPELVSTIGVEQPEQFHKHNVYEHILAVVDAVPKEKPLIRLAALFHDVGKPGAKEWNESKQRHMFIGHEDESMLITRDAMGKERMAFSTDDRKYVEMLVKNHMLQYDPDKWSDKAVRKLINRMGGLDGVKDLVILHHADVTGTGREGALDDAQHYTDLLMKRIAGLGVQTGGSTMFGIKDLAIGGKDVMTTLGIPPGKEIGQALNHLYELVLDDMSLNNRDDLIRLLKEMK